MARPPLNRLYAPRTLAVAVASGAAEMIPFHRARGWTRAAIIAAPGIGYAGALVWVMTRRGAGEHALDPSQQDAPGQAGEQGPDQRWTPQLLGVTAAVGVVMSGLSAAGLAIDGAVERFLVRRSVRRPLLAMGAMGMVVGWALEYLDLNGGHDDGGPSAAGPGKHRNGDRPVDAPPRL